MTSDFLNGINTCPEAFSHLFQYLQPQDIRELSLTCKKTLQFCKDFAPKRPTDELGFCNLYRNSETSVKEASNIRTALKKLPSYADKNVKFIPVAAKTKGCTLGTIYQRVENQYIGKIGRDRGFFKGDVVSTRSRTTKDCNTDAIREKIASDLYLLLSEGFFLVPPTYLSCQRVNDPYTRDHLRYRHEVTNLEDKGIYKCLRIMSEVVDGYNDFSKAETQIDDQRLKFIDFLKTRHRPPDTILTEDGNSVPLLGIMELAATGRILGDTDWLGGTAENAGWKWVRDQS